MDAQRQKVREALAQDLGSGSEDYNAEKYLNDHASGPIANDGG